MRRIAIAMVAAGACASTRAPVALRGRIVACGGVEVALPASLRLLAETATALVAASDDAAVIVARAPAQGRARASLVDVISDADQPRFRYAVRRARGCLFTAVATFPITADGDRLTAAAAGSAPEIWLIGSPRIAIEPPLAVLRHQLGGYAATSTATASSTSAPTSITPPRTRTR